MIRPDYEVMHNVKIKSFPLAGVQKMTVCSDRIFRESGWEYIDAKPPISKPQKQGTDSRGDSTRRAKQKVFELAMLNRFTHFITWTLDASEIDRYDAKEVSRKLKDFLHNQVKRKGAKYIIIPEHHKDGAIHMHGLISGAFDFVDSGHVTVKGQKVYNMPQWKYGFSTAVKLDGNVNAIARYITKYITKDFKKIFGNFYYAGGKLVRNPDVILDDIDYSQIDTKEYYIKDIRRGFKYLDLDAPCEDYSENQFDIAE